MLVFYGHIQIWWRICWYVWPNLGTSMICAKKARGWSPIGLEGLHTILNISSPPLLPWPPIILLVAHMGVSINGDTPKWLVYKKPSYKWMIWGYPHLWKPPYMLKVTEVCAKKGRSKAEGCSWSSGTGLPWGHTLKGKPCAVENLSMVICICIDTFICMCVYVYIYIHTQT